MSYVWTGLTLLFFFSLMMLALSVFTPKTAWFFKDKSKLRGAILWMSTALVCAVLVNEAGPKDTPFLRITTEAQSNGSTPPPSPDTLPGFSYAVVEQIPQEKIVIRCSLGNRVDEERLKTLALKVYASNKGQNFKKVYINWHILEEPEQSGAWAETNCLDGNWQIRLYGTQQG